MDDTSLETFVNAEFSGQRLDAAAAGLFPDFSRSRLTAWIKEGRLTVDGEVLKPKLKVFEGQHLVLSPGDEPETSWVAQDIEVPVIYEDEDLIIVDKAINQVVHPGAGNPGGTLVNGLLHRYPELETLPRCGIVHRIDKDTSGLLAVARSERAHKSLTRQLQDRSMGREYWCIALGEIRFAGQVDAPIGRHPTQRTKMAVVGSGRESLTYYDIEDRYPGATELSVTLATGRTHQIRVHMAHIGHPLLGDPLYGGNRPLPSTVPNELKDVQQRLTRQALHARRLSLIHPADHEVHEWESPLPADLAEAQAILEAL